MKPILGWSLAVAASMAAVPLCANAQHMGHDRAWRGDIVHFEAHDLNHWRAGGWRHGWHGGRMGWWWVLGGTWYFYPQPIYPYPDPYVPPTVVIQQPPQVVVQTPAPTAPTAPAANPTVAQWWYYCEAPKGYYPYVASCPSGWKSVPATPPAAPQ